MSGGAGFRLGQGYGFGRTQQSTIIPGTANGFPVVAAGANYSCSLQRNDYWRLVGLAFTLTVDSTDNNRFVQVQYPGGPQSTIMVRDLAGYTQPKSTVVHYTATLNGLVLQDGDSPVNASFRLSGLWLEAGRTITIAVDGIAGGDAITALALTFDRTLVDDDGSEVIIERQLEQRIAEEVARS